MYAARHERVTAALRDDLPMAGPGALRRRPARVRPPAARRAASTSTPCSRGRAAAGVAVESLAAYGGAAGRRGLVLGYGAVRTDAIATGLRVLARCFQAP